MINKHLFRTLTVFLCMISLAVGVGLYFSSYYQTNTKPEIQGLLWPGPIQLNSFTTIDHNGNAFGIDRLRGKWSFIFFGYTHCPDVCPITLSVLNEVYNKLQKTNQTQDLQIMFVTIDPERDTSQRLNDYVGYFNAEFIGLGGNIEQIQSLTSQIGVFYMYGARSEAGNYLVDHTASIFLMDPNGRMVGIFSTPHQMESILTRFRQIKAFIESQT